MRIGVSRHTLQECHDGGTVVIETFNDLLNCYSQDINMNLAQFIFRYINEPIVFIVYEKVGDMRNVEENNTAVAAFRRHEIDTIFPSIKRPNYNLPFEEQLELSRNVSYVFMHQVYLILKKQIFESFK